MKNISCIALFLVLSILLVACVRESGNIQDAVTPSNESSNEAGPVSGEVENHDVTIGADTIPNDSTEHGEFREIVDSYGFPFYFRMTEGMEMTKVEIFEDHAERYWTHSLSNSPTLHENLIWSITGDHLIISGEWEEEFIIDIEAGTATSLSNRKVYRLVVYSEDGATQFYVE